MRLTITPATVAWVVLALAATPRLALATPSACDAAAGNLVQNCGFESGSFADWAQSGNMEFTMVTSGNPNLVHSGNFGVGAGPVGSNGFISQTLADTAGALYRISIFFDPSGHTPSDFQIQWNGQVRLDLANTSHGWDTQGSPQWQLETVIAHGTGSDLLTIGFRDDQGWLGVDDVSVVAVSEREVAEPASLLLLATGLLGLGLRRRKTG